MRSVVEVENLEKFFVVERPILKQVLAGLAGRKKVLALEGINFSIQSGEILGVVGPNGAGKTTLLRILADLLQADGGLVRLCGHELGNGNHQMRRKIGYVPSDERSFFWRLTGRQNLRFFGRLYGLSSKESDKRISQSFRAFGFDSKGDQLFSDYSAGMRKKIAVMRAMLHRPCLLLLDEVTNSLDLMSAKLVKTFVREHISSTRDCASVWSTHRIEETGEICDKVVMIEDGQVSFCGRVSDFHSKHSQKANYLLRVRNMDGVVDMFCKQWSESSRVELCQKGDVSEFVFNEISGEDFGHIITTAVKNYGAYVVYAGCLGKNGGVVGR